MKVKKDILKGEFLFFCNIKREIRSQAIGIGVRFGGVEGDRIDPPEIQGPYRNNSFLSLYLESIIFTVYYLSHFLLYAI